MTTLEEIRMSICKQCPIYTVKSYGAVCDGSKFINPDTGEWSWIKKPGYIRGCSCSLKQKVKNVQMHCPAKKW